MEHTIEKINAKLSLLGYPYIITKDLGIKLIHNDFEEINIVAPVKYITKEIFYRNYGLNKVKLPDTLTFIQSRAFAHCRELKEIEIPTTTRILNEFCFLDTGIREIVIPENVRILDNSCFCMCKRLEKVTFKGIPSFIADDAFDSTSSLKTIEIPKNSLKKYISLFRNNDLKGIKIVEV